MTFAEIVQESTQGEPGCFIISEMKLQWRRDIFLYMKALSFFFFLSPSSEGSNTVFVFCLW